MKRYAAATVMMAMLAGMSACASRPDDAFVSSVRALRPSVVLLTMKLPPENKKDPYDDGYGSGVVVASGAWGSDVLTVQHAIDSAYDMRVTIGDKKKVVATTLAFDANLDVALVRIAEPNLPFARLGTSKSLEEQLGRRVALIGYPIPDEFSDEGLGLAPSLASGILSSVRKDAFEVSMPIVPGESGGPVFIADTGEIIGLADSRFDDERSIGFAVPIDDAKAFLHRHDSEHGF